MARLELITKQGRVLMHVAHHPDTRLTDICSAVGITERAVQTILRTLEKEGVVSKTPVGRGRRYTVHYDVLFSSGLLDVVSMEDMAFTLRALARRLETDGGDS